MSCAIDKTDGLILTLYYEVIKLLIRILCNPYMMDTVLDHLLDALQRVFPSIRHAQCDVKNVTVNPLQNLKLNKLEALPLSIRISTHARGIIWVARRGMSKTSPGISTIFQLIG